MNHPSPPGLKLFGRIDLLPITALRVGGWRWFLLGGGGGGGGGAGGLAAHSKDVYCN